MIDYLLEIGFEEFPPSFLPGAAAELAGRIKGLLEREKIFYRTCRIIYSSRRMGVLVLGLTRKQKPQVAEIQGPPRKLCYDADGNPTVVLNGFLKTHGLETGAIKIINTPKGEYVSARKEILPKDTEEILYQGTPQIIASLEFPKTMVWNDSGVRFPRPIRWIIALLDRRPLRFTYAGLKADRYSMPNVHFATAPIRLEKPREYLSKLRHGGVIADPNERRKIILMRIKQAAKAAGSEALLSDEIVAEINCSVEYPDVVAGEFNAEFLALPPEVLAATLKVNGDLIWVKDTNKFLCIFNAKKKAADNIRAGYTQVVHAKLKDAHFFYDHDLKTGINAMREQSKGMTWMYSHVLQRTLGTVFDKTERLREMAKSIPWSNDVYSEHLFKAAELCKADLLSEMIGEKDFTGLQGIMGSYYARAAGEPETVARAIMEHYLPRFTGDALPESKEGAALSICDKIDHVFGAILSIGVRSGSSDPLAIRRNGYAVIQTIDRFGFDISIWSSRDFLFNAYDINKETKSNRDMPGNVMRIFTDFFKDQMSRYLEEQGFRYDEINSVLTDWDGNVVTGRLRCAALKQWRGKPEFEKLVVGQKRIRNILYPDKKSGNKIVCGEVNETLLKEPAERKLFARGSDALGKIDPMFNDKKFDGILNILLGMREDIDTFFDKVMVMCEDPELRKNRLALVNFINQLFLRFADLSQIVIESEKK